MRNLFIGLVMAAGFCAPAAALAQDSAEFAGFKVGVSADYRWLKGDADTPDLKDRLKDRESGFGFRGHVGYDIPIGERLVLGAEGGLSKGGESLSLGNKLGRRTLDPELSWDVSARLGMAVSSDFMIYGRAGYAWQRVKDRTEINSPAKTIEDTRTEGGLLYGAGVETRLNSNLLVRLEYDRAEFGDNLSSQKLQVGVSLGF
ncbi:outer membrane protein [Caulobacter mirabilis]|nr:porin family protein [Caulobacter mirabilis]